MSNPIYSFSTVKREQSKASIVIEGLSGKGKSGLALILAKALAGDWENVFNVDTENNSIQLYDGIPCSLGGKFENFKHANFSPEIKFRPSNYKAFKEAAIEAGAKALIFDSITHAWNAEGGILDMVAEKKQNNTRYSKDSYAVWGDEEVVKEKQLLMELFRDHRVHMICTVRVKEKMEYEADAATGKNKIVSLGEQQIMQADLKYEPDLVLSMVTPGSKDKAPVAHVVKSRYAILEVDKDYEFTPGLCEQIRKYLEEGTSPEELLEQQRQEYITGVKQFLDTNKNAVPLWKQLKADKGYAETKLEEMPLDTIKEIFLAITN